MADQRSTVIFLISYLSFKYDVGLRILSGGHGCFKLTAEITGVDAKKAAEISRKIMIDPTFPIWLVDDER